jgi:hypothetical protein
VGEGARGGAMVMAVVRVELLLITDYVYDVSSSNHEFRINDDILSTLILASSCISNDTQNCCKRQNCCKYLRLSHSWIYLVIF